MGGEVCLIQTTLPGTWIEAEVGAFSQQMLDAGAACVQHHSIHSMYRWEESIESSPEWHLQLKVTPNKREDVLLALSENHPYKIPQIVWTIADSTNDYSAWVSEEFE